MPIDGNIEAVLTARDLTGPAFQSVQSRLKELGNEAEATGAKLDASLAGRIGMVAGAAAVGFGAILAVGVKAFNAVKEYHDETRRGVSAIADHAAELQMSAERFQVYGFAADQVGVSNERLVGTLSRFQAKIGEAAAGNKGAIESFQALNVKLLDSEGRLRSETQLLTETAASILRMGDANTRAAAAKDLLGVSGARAIPLLQQFAQGVGNLEDKARGAGVVIGGEVVEAANKLENQSHQTSLAVRKFYAEIGMPIEVAWLKAVESLVGGIADAYRRAQDEQKKFRDSAPTRAAEGDAQVLRDRLAAAEQGLQRNPNDKLQQSSVAALRAQLAEAERVATEAAQAQGRASTTAADQQRLFNDGLPAQGGGGRDPTVVKSTGSGGGSARDRIGENLNQLVGEREAIDRALAGLQANIGTPLKEIERTVEVQRRIDDMVARLTKTDAGDKRAGEIRAVATELERSRYAYQEYMRASADADQWETKYGDGKREVEDTQRRLSAAIGTGRLSLDAYNIAVRESILDGEKHRLTMIGQQGGFTGLAAGFKAAALDYARSNTEFAVGGRLFQDTANLMSSSFTKWRKTGQFDMGEFLGSFADMLAQMAMQVAASQIGKSLFGGGGGLGGILGGFLGGGGGGTGAGLLDGIFTATQGSPFMFADGGRPPVGVPSMIGEQGPELWVPDSAGTIIPNDKLAAGGGDTLVINQTINLSTGVAQTVRAEVLSMLPMISNAAASAVVDKRQRGGSFAGAFR